MVRRNGEEILSGAYYMSGLFKFLIKRCNMFVITLKTSHQNNPRNQCVVSSQPNSHFLGLGNICCIWKSFWLSVEGRKGGLSLDSYKQVPFFPSSSHPPHPLPPSGPSTGQENRKARMRLLKAWHCRLH